MKIRNSLFIVLAATAAMLAPSTSSAQNGTMSPYSRFGYGILSDNATSMQRQMGSVGVAMNSGRQINVMNPASYAAIDSLTFLFDMGVDFTTLWQKEGDESAKQYGGGLDYITMAFPLGKHFGASVGLLPYSSVGYSFGSEIKHGTSKHNGSGSLNQLYGGLAVTPVKGLYAGVNVAYLFGSTTNDAYATAQTGSVSIFRRDLTVSDWRMDIGLQGSFNIGSKNRFTLGATYSPRKGLHGKTYCIYYDTALEGTQGFKPDTVGYTSLRGRFSLPETWAAGINYNWANRLMIEADFLYQPWAKAKFNPLEDIEANQFSNRWRAGFGVQITPDPRGSYLGRMQYRLGGYYNNDYLMIQGNKVRDYVATLGFGVPVPGFKTIVNVGLEYRYRRAYPNPLIKENYLNLTIGVNFNEMWFFKRKL